MSAYRLPEALRLASNARGNGLPAAQWVMIADATPARADALLEVLGAAGVPARAARVRPRSPRAADTRVWVDIDRLARAENVLMAMLGAGGSIGCAAPRVPPEPVENSGSALFDDLLVGRLRSSWGFCTSHAWLYLCREAELPSWPVANAAIYRDLTCHAVRLLEALHGRRRTHQALAGIEPCMLCEYGTDPAPSTRSLQSG